MELTAAQCRAARAFLRWSVQELADRAKIGRNTVIRFENDTVVTITATSAVIRRAFEDAGIVFIGKDGVRLPVEDDDEDESVEGDGDD